jgi:hypothetical protein
MRPSDLAKIPIPRRDKRHISPWLAAHSAPTVVPGFRPVCRPPGVPTARCADRPVCRPPGVPGARGHAVIAPETGRRNPTDALGPRLSKRLACVNDRESQTM